MSCSARALAAWLLVRELAEGGDATEPAPQTVELSPFQMQAAARARRIMDRHGGVLVADSVGLGKTYIALSLIERALANGAVHVLIATPAALRRQWWALLRRAANAHGATLVGAHGHVKRDRPLLCWLSHHALSHACWPDGLNPTLAVIDEAHGFRNPRTRRYRSLAALCRNSRVVLLSATPINNSLIDLYWQLRLFLSDGAFAGDGVSDLRLAFDESASAGRLLPPLDAIVASVTVRRTRSMVIHREPQVETRFPVRAPPLAVSYDVETVVPGFFRRVGAAIESLRLDAFTGLRPDGRAPLELMRFALLKRLESSTHAFRTSILGLERYLTAFAEAVREGYRLDPQQHRILGGAMGSQLFLFGLALPALAPGADRERLARSALRDAERLRSLLEWLEPFESQDPKLAMLRVLLAGPLGGRKVLVFTEFRDTALWLWRALETEFRVAMVDGQGARIGRMPVPRAEAVTRFAPMSNGRPAPRESERVDVLIATDVLSEGLNLQDAADVVSYDLPWNPVRLIQRIGRIDRLGSPHERVRCWSFVPARGLDALLRLLDRLAAKLEAIRTLGRDAPVLFADQPPQPLASVATGVAVKTTTWSTRPASPMPRTQPATLQWRPPVIVARPVRSVVGRIAAGDPQLFDDLEQEEEGPFALLERARELAADPAVTTLARDACACATPRSGESATPPVLRIRQAAKGDPCHVVAVEPAGDQPLRWFIIERGAVREDRLASLAILLALLELDACAVECVAADPEIQRVVKSTLATLRRSESAPHGSQRTRLRVRDVLMRALEREPGGPDAALCRRADALLDRLATGLRAGAERAVLETLRRRTAGPRRPRKAADLLRALEAALGPGAETRPGPAAARAGPRIIAILDVQSCSAISRPE